MLELASESDHESFPRLERSEQILEYTIESSWRELIVAMSGASGLVFPTQCTPDSQCQSSDQLHLHTEEESYTPSNGVVDAL